MNNIIESFEAAGAARARAQSLLPVAGKHGHQRLLQAAGAVIGEDVDEILTRVTLPPDWTVLTGPDPRGSALLDEKRRYRFCSFYKGVSYGPYGYLDPKPRLGMVTHQGEAEDGTILDRGHPLAPGLNPLERIIPWPVLIKLPNSELGQAWLDEHFPNWKDPGAYWDVDVLTWEGQ